MPPVRRKQSATERRRIAVAIYPSKTSCSLSITVC